MRLKARIRNHPQLNIAIIHQEASNSFFVYEISEDHEHGFDNWSPDLHSAKAQCKRDYNIDEHEWEEIPDTLPGALPQFEEPTVGIRDESGKLLFISYEEALERDIVPPKKMKIEIIDNPKLIAKIRSYLAQDNPLKAMQLYMLYTDCDIPTAKQVIKHLRNNEDYTNHENNKSLISYLQAFFDWLTHG